MKMIGTRVPIEGILRKCKCNLIHQSPKSLRNVSIKSPNQNVTKNSEDTDDNWYHTVVSVLFLRHFFTTFELLKLTIRIIEIHFV